MRKLLKSPVTNWPAGYGTALHILTYQNPEKLIQDRRQHSTDKDTVSPPASLRQALSRLTIYSPKDTSAVLMNTPPSSIPQEYFHVISPILSTTKADGRLLPP